MHIYLHVSLVYNFYPVLPSYNLLESWPYQFSAPGVIYDEHVVRCRCQVLVVGGGPSGLSAALGARRAGADVILMERFGCFGGVITTVGMETLAWYR